MTREQPSSDDGACPPYSAGLPKDVRLDIYRQLQLTSNQIDNVEYMVANCGQRDVGAGAKDNVRVQLFSKKNDDARVLESHTCEGLYAYELELDPQVLGYYAQPPCLFITRIKENGRRHVSSATLDFLVFRREQISIVECKQLHVLEKLAITKSEWINEDGTWTNSAYKTWAEAQGMVFSLWSPPAIFTTYLQNLEAIYEVLSTELTSEDMSVVTRACRILSNQAMSLDDLQTALPGFRARTALWMLAHRKAYGPVVSTPIDLTEHFFLCSCTDQATDVDLRRYERLKSHLEQPYLADPVLLASATDIRSGMERLKRLRSIERGDAPSSKRMLELARKVKKASQEGGTELSACLTNYANSGNRTDRLTTAQREELNQGVTDWVRAKPGRKIDRYFAMKESCEAHHVVPPGRTSLYSALAKTDPALRALHDGGLRSYHAVRPRVDPRHRSLPPLLYGHTLHIDSSQFDNRCGPHLLTFLPVDKPIFYIGMDDATDEAMAHSFVFGSAKTDGILLLLREFVRRHGFLPSVIFIDRGPENTSLGLRILAKELCITIKHSPTGGSRYNGRAENAVKRVNTQIAHRFPGSTEKDAMGRKVDGRFKSKRSQKTAFLTILDEFQHYVYEDLPTTPGEDGITPAERREQALLNFGRAGRAHPYNDDLLISTSVPLRHFRATERDGLRTSYGHFGSTELQLALRTEKPSDVRADCADPTVIYAKIGGIWIKGFHKSVHRFFHLTNNERLFALLARPDDSRHRREEKERIDYDRHFRQKATAAMQAHPHLLPTNEEPKREEMSSPPEDLTPFDWSGIEIIEEEDRSS